MNKDFVMEESKMSMLTIGLVFAKDRLDEAHGALFPRDEHDLKMDNSTIKEMI